MVVVTVKNGEERVTQPLACHLRSQQSEPRDHPFNFFGEA
jgi:hypothetical protein